MNHDVPKPEAVKAFLLDLQDRLCAQVETLESAADTAITPAKFREDIWQRDPHSDHSTIHGGGRTRVLRGGTIFEQAGIGFSDVYGTALPPSASASRSELAGRGFRAMGVSLVFHPRNPYVPTTHMNVRLFLATKPDAEPVWWVGGGFDLTPFYPFDADVRHWHQVAKDLSDPFGSELYPKYKKWCDEYFYLKHRQETRGVGGLFFDDLHDLGFAQSFAYLQAVANGFFDAYFPIVMARHALPYGEREREFQRYRRGRYVEFNLVWDRGTLFGLQSGGRTESILMSLPPDVRFEYGYQPTPGSAEAKLQDYLVARDWLNH